MTIFNNQGAHPMLNMHSDILYVTIPEDMDGKQRLFDETKARGNTAFKAKRFDEAEFLYTRALEIFPECTSVYGNRSASRAGMGKFQLALEDADKCIQLDPSWLKGLYRRAQALMKLKKYSSAVESLEALLEKDSALKDAKKMLEEAKRLASETPMEVQRVEEPEKKKVVKRVAVKSDSDNSSKNPSTSSSTEKVDVEDGEDLKGHVRGYKVLADGRKTTFFNNELSEEDKKLIGDIAPKRVQETAAVQINAVEGGSAWNQGNTFEEKGTGHWASKRIQELFLAATWKSPTSDHVVKVKEVKDMEGDASIAVMRGAKRYIFEYTLSLNCELYEGQEKKAEGVVKFLDLSSDDDFDVEIVVGNRHHSADGKYLYEVLTNQKTGFQSELQRQMDKFVAEYHQM